MQGICNQARHDVEIKRTALQTDLGVHPNSGSSRKDFTSLGLFPHL